MLGCEWLNIWKNNLNIYGRMCFDTAISNTAHILGGAALLITSCNGCLSYKSCNKPDKSCNKSSKSANKSNN